MEHPVRYNDEGEIQKELGVESWRNLPKNKMVKLVAMMPDMDKEVALKIVEQLPEFGKFAAEMLGVVQKAHESTLGANEKSQAHVHRAFQEIREILKGELQGDLSWDEKKYIYDLLMETGNREFAKDSETKRNLDVWFKAVGVVAVSALALTIALVGGRVMLESGDGGEGPSEA